MTTDTLPQASAFYKAIAEKFDLVCDCRLVPVIELRSDGFHSCGACGRYVSLGDEA
jgi:hypothetical protein